jgi:hypothetical protein
MEESEEFEVSLDPLEYLKDYTGLNLFFRLENLIKNGHVSAQTSGEENFASFIESAIANEANQTHYW